MAISYVNDLRLSEMATGDNSGTWGTVTNTNLELIGDALGYGTRAIADASADNITIADGTADADRAMYLKLSGGGQACEVTLLPTTVSKVWIMENGTNSALTFKQGSSSSGDKVIIPAGDTKIIATDGGGGSGVVYDVLTSLSVVDLKVQDDLTVTDDVAIGGLATVGGTLGVTGKITADAGIDIDNFNIDGTTIALSSGNMTIDAAAGDIILEGHSNGTVQLTKQGTQYGTFFNGSDDLTIQSVVSDKDIVFKGNDGGSDTEVLRLDMSAAGAATFNANVGIGSAPSSTIRNDGSAQEKALQIGTRAMLFSDGGVSTDLQNNSHLNNSDNRVAMATDLGSIYQQYQGVHKWLNAASVSAGATQSMTERMRIDASGNLGIGNAGGFGLLSVAGSVAVVANDANKKVSFWSTGNGNSENAKIAVDNDGSTTNTGEMKFSTRNASNSLGERMRISASGLVGIGTTSPDKKLTVAGTASFVAGFNDPAVTITGGTTIQGQGKIKFTGAGTALDHVSMANDGVSAVFGIERSQGTGLGGSTDAYACVIGTITASRNVNIIAANQKRTTIDTSGNLTQTGNVTANSDIRQKENIQTIQDALKKVTSMRGVMFDKKSSEHDYSNMTKGSGVIAQELEKIAPELVLQGETYKSVAYGNIVGYLIEAIKELEARITILER